MGLYVKGANGAFYGKVGSVVGSNWRAINYLRSLPKPSNKKATEKQKTHRAKFAMVLRFLAPMRQLINMVIMIRAVRNQLALIRLPTR